MHRHARIVAPFAALLLSTGPAAADTVIVEGFNDGEMGFVVVAVLADPGTVPEMRHDVTSKCAYKATHRPNSGIADYTVTGKTHAGPHPRVAFSTIRCRLIDHVGRVIVDETRSMPGPVATIEINAPHPTTVARICASGSGTWEDHHIKNAPEHCR